MKIFLCRHGQTTGDIENRYGGNYDDHLTDEGKKQAAELAEKLKGCGVEKIFCSPLIRAKETAGIVKEVLGVEVEVIDGLRERNQYGILTGMIKSEAKEKHPDQVAALKDYRNTIDEAESYDSLVERVNEAIDYVVNKNLSVLAIITHGGPIKAVLRQISYADDYKIKDCAIVELEIGEADMIVVSLDGVSEVKE